MIHIFPALMRMPFEWIVVSKTFFMPMACTVIQWDVLLSNVSSPAWTRSSCLRSPRASLFWWTEVVHN
jgi:hypothetical protein